MDWTPIIVGIGIILGAMGFVMRQNAISNKNTIAALQKSLHETTQNAVAEREAQKKENERLQQRIDDETERLQKRNDSENERLQKRVDEAESKLMQATRDLANAEGLIQAHYKHSRDLTDELSKANQNIGARDQAVLTLTKENENNQIEIKKVTKERDQYQEQLEEYKRLYNELMNSGRINQEEFNSRLLAKEGEINGLRVTIASLQEQIETFNKTLEIQKTNTA